MNINYRIDKKELVNSFKDYIASTIDRNDLYSSNGKQVQYRNDYITLEKIKSIYNYIIKYIKLGIRKELIHDDDAYIFIINKLNDRMNNKIRSTSNGKFYMSVGLKDPINFDGNKDQYESYIYNKANLARLVKKIVEELNAVLENNITQEKDKTVINNNIKEHITPVHIINKLLENINKKIILEIFEGNFSNFDKYYFEFMKENNIDLDLAKKMIENIHSSFIDSDVPVNMLNKKIQEVDPPKQTPSDLVDQNISLAGQSIEKGFAQQQPAIEPEIETGLSDKELEYIRKMNENDVSI